MLSNSQSLIQLQKYDSCPKCNSSEFTLYNDCLFCFDCKTRIKASDYKPDLQNLLNNLNTSMDHCGKWAKHEIYCKQCEDSGQTESLLHVEKRVHVCRIRLCNKPLCISTRYAETLEAFEGMKRFEGLKKLHHFSVGFEKISKEEFEQNYEYHKKRFERTLNVYFKRLKQNGINIQGFRVLDISKGMNTGAWDNQYYIHFHFAAIPCRKSDYRKTLSVMKLIEQIIKSKQKIKIPFHFQSWGLKDKMAIFKYLTIRAIGLYKQYEAVDTKVDSDFIKALSSEKFMSLRDLLTNEQYVKQFFKKRNIAIIGNHYFCYSCKKEIPLRTNGKPTYPQGEEKICPHCNSKEVKLALKSLHSPNSRDIMVLVYCKTHGKFNAGDFLNLRHEFSMLDDAPPPDILSKNFKKSILTIVHALKIELINTETGEITKVYHNKNKKIKPVAIIKKSWNTLK